MRIAICDDNKKEREKLRSYIETYCTSRNFSCEIMEASCGEDFLEIPHIEECSLIFMDIFMGKLNGLETAAKLQDLGYSGGYIFTTTSKEHVFSSFAFDVIDYLVKPYSDQQLYQALDKFFKTRATSLLSISVLVDGSTVALPLHKIYCIETNASHSTLIHLKDTSLHSQTLISELETMLSPYPNFLRCHRSYLINMDEVSGVKDTTVYMTNGVLAHLPQRNSFSLKNQINDYLWKKMMED